MRFFEERQARIGAMLLGAGLLFCAICVAVAALY